MSFWAALSCLSDSAKTCFNWTKTKLTVKCQSRISRYFTTMSDAKTTSSQRQNHYLKNSTEWLTNMALFCISYWVLVNTALGRSVRSRVLSLQIDSGCQWTLTGAVSPTGPRPTTLSAPAAQVEKWIDTEYRLNENFWWENEEYWVPLKCTSLYTLGFKLLTPRRSFG